MELTDEDIRDRFEDGGKKLFTALKRLDIATNTPVPLAACSCLAMMVDAGDVQFVDHAPTGSRDVCSGRLIIATETTLMDAKYDEVLARDDVSRPGTAQKVSARLIPLNEFHELAWTTHTGMRSLDVEMGDLTLVSRLQEVQLPLSSRHAYEGGRYVMMLRTLLDSARA